MKGTYSSAQGLGAPSARHRDAAAGVAGAVGVGAAGVGCAEPQELSTSALAKLEAASDEVEFQQSIWDASLFLFNPVAGRGASLFAFLLLVVNVFLQETRLSTYPDFAHDCGDFTQCGNTCCVPSNGTAQAMAGG